MLREKAKLITQAHSALDICLTVGAFIAAYFIKRHLLPESFRGLTTDPNYYVVLLMIIIIWYVVFGVFGLYGSYRKETFGRIFRNMVKAVLVGMVVLSMVMYLGKIVAVSRIMMGIFFLLNIGLLAISKGIIYRTLIKFRQNGFNFRNILIVGSRERAKDVINAIGDHLGSGFRVLGCLELEERDVGGKVKNGNGYLLLGKD